MKSQPYERSINFPYITKLKKGESVGSIEVIRTPNGKMIQEGHHRYIASKFSGKEVPIVKMGIGDIRGPSWNDIKYSTNIINYGVVAHKDYLTRRAF